MVEYSVLHCDLFCSCSTASCGVHSAVDIAVDYIIVNRIDLCLAIERWGWGSVRAGLGVSRSNLSEAQKWTTSPVVGYYRGLNNHLYQKLRDEPGPRW